MKPGTVGRVLIIDDDTMQSEIYEIALTARGIDVQMANTAQNGFEFAKKEKPDLILLDLLLGKENGVDLLKKLKSDPDTSAIKIIILTNFQKQGLEIECLASGAEEFVIKSNIIPKELVDKIIQYLKK